MIDFGPQNLSVSPDGKQFVYCTTQGLYLRSLGELDAKPIAGSDKPALVPFFSPDGKSIAYVSTSDMKLKRISIGGGAPVEICKLEGFRGGNWAPHDFIVFSMPPKGIMRISSNGGTPEILVEQKSELMSNPQILPDGESVLYTSALQGGGNPRIMVKRLKAEEPKELFSGWFIRYLPCGYIVYGDSENNLCAVPFDIDKLDPRF